MIRIQVDLETEVIFENGVWRGDNPAAVRAYTATARTVKRPHGGHPDPDGYIARQVVAELGGEIVEAVPLDYEFDPEVVY